MALKLGTTDIQSMYLGTTAITKLYVGTEEIWPLASVIPVAFGTAGTPATSGGNANTLTTANAPITVGSESNRMLMAVVGVSNANTASFSTFDILTCTGSVDGAMTRLASASVNVSGGNQGSVHLFYLPNPTAGAQNIVAQASLPSTTWLDRVRVQPFYFYNVHQTTPFGTPNLVQVTGAASNTLATSGANSQVLFGYVGSSSPTTTFNKTQIGSTFGSTDNGAGDYILAGYDVGGVSTTFTTTNSTRNGNFAVEILPA